LARQAKDLTTNQEELERLKAYARVVALDTHRDKFDPDTHHEDSAREDEFIATSKATHEARIRAEFKQRDLEAIEQRNPEYRRQDPRANAHLVLALVLTTLAFATTLAPSSHDPFFFKIAGDRLRWALYIGTSATIAAGVVALSYIFAWSAARKGSHSVLGSLGGVIVFVGFGCLRLASAASMAEILFAVALTLTEIGVLVLLHAAIIELGHQYCEWMTARAVVETARVAAERAKNNVAELERKSNAFIDYVEDRTLRNIEMSRLTSTFQDALIAGYTAGIESNKGYLRGSGDGHDHLTHAARNRHGDSQIGCCAFDTVARSNKDGTS
jgi:hypothetical protein